MKIEYDNQVDAIYIRLQEKYVTRTVEIEDGLNIDLDENGKLIGTGSTGCNRKICDDRSLQYLD